MKEFLNPTPTQILDYLKGLSRETNTVHEFAILFEGWRYTEVTLKIHEIPLGKGTDVSIISHDLTDADENYTISGTYVSWDNTRFRKITALLTNI